MRRFLVKMVTVMTMAGAMMSAAVMPMAGALAVGVTEVAVREDGALVAEVDHVDTNIIGGESGVDVGDGKTAIENILKLVANILIYGLGVAAVLGVVIAGIMYMTARDNEQQVAKAKMRLFEVVIGLIAWAVMFAVLNWLLPGGAPSLDL